ncbi:MAG: signal recognition particle-docking protein FtsY [Candidatus Micrarchaeia archaeon]
MFNLLKNKISNFVGKLVGREEEKKPQEEQKIQPKEEEAIAQKITQEEIAPAKEKHSEKAREDKKIEAPAQEKGYAAEKIIPAREKKIEETVFEKKIEKAHEKKTSAETSEQKKKIHIHAQEQVEAKKTVFVNEEKQEIATDAYDKKISERKPIAHAPKPAKKHEIEIGEELDTQQAKELERLEKRALSQKEPQMKAKVGITKTITGFFSPTITIERTDVADLLEDLEISLLESDVAYEVSLEVVSRLEKKLIGMKVQKSKMHEEIAGTIKQVLIDIMTSAKAIDFDSKVSMAKKPAKILFVGPNGAGKTTTIAKIANRLKSANLSVVLAASDTFRAAAIEQLGEHANRLDVPIIKSEYGSDPTSVAFDAIKYANAHDIDVVLIDSAGRQDTNTNLIDEMKKMNRVIKPDLKIYIGESIGGNAIIEQIKGFHDAIGIDGAILTKLDCDAKGGTAISLSYATGVPILFIGIGQKYSDIKIFDAYELANQMLA